MLDGEVCKIAMNKLSALNIRSSVLFGVGKYTLASLGGNDMSSLPRLKH